MSDRLASLRKSLPDSVPYLEQLVHNYAAGRSGELQQLLIACSDLFEPVWNRQAVLYARGTRLLREQAERLELWGEVPCCADEAPPPPKVVLSDDVEEVFQAIIALASQVRINAPPHMLPPINPAVRHATRIRKDYLWLLASNLRTERMLNDL